MTVHSRSIPLRAFAAAMDYTLMSASKPRRLVDFAKALLKFPVEYRAAHAQQAVPAATFGQLFGQPENLSLSVDPAALDRHGWNVKLHEEVYLSAAVQAVKPLRIFEIGTFDGNTTRCLAEAAPDTAEIFTIDLPEEMFDATQGPEAFNGSQVGERYRDSPARAKIQQIRADATAFDFSPYYRTIDFVFVDASHDYPHGLTDTRNALRMVRPGGAIIWHDFEPYWSGLVHAICEATAGQPLKRLSGTSFAVLLTPER
jgi:predicted O-methyltransferase YrrM